MERGASILIAGAGPTGLAAAIELKRRGFSPRIVDRDAGPTPIEQSRALGVLPATLAVLEASGMTQQLLSDGERVNAFTLHLGDRVLATLTTHGARTPYPFILMVPQGRTERLMIEALADLGVAVEWGTSVDRVVETGSGVEVGLSKGETMRVDALIGCDGGRSVVREALGIGWSGEEYEAKFALADLRLSQPIDPSMAHAMLRSGSGATAILPIGPNLVRVIGFAVGTRATIAAFPNVAETVWESDFTVSFRHAERMATRRVYLAGDAAHIHSPVGARGMNIGIHDAATLAFLFEKGREADYEKERLPVAENVLRMTRRMTDFVLRRSPTTEKAMTLLLPMASRVPFVQRRIAERMLGLDLRPPWLG